MSADTNKPNNKPNNEAGFAGGAEALVFGFLLLFVVTLIIANGWAVIHTKFALSSGSREATRVYVEEVLGGSDDARATSLAQSVGQDAIEGYGSSYPNEVVVDAGGDRCTVVTAEATSDVPFFILPGISTRASIRVSARHSERVDPFRSGIEGEVSC